MVPEEEATWTAVSAISFSLVWDACHASSPLTFFGTQCPSRLVTSAVSLFPITMQALSSRSPACRALSPSPRLPGFLLTYPSHSFPFPRRLDSVSRRLRSLAILPPRPSNPCSRPPSNIYLLSRPSRCTPTPSSGPRPDTLPPGPGSAPWPSWRRPHGIQDVFGRRPWSFLPIVFRRCDERVGMR